MKKKILSNIKIAIVYSLPTTRMLHTAFSATDDDTVLSAKEIQHALKLRGIESTLIPMTTHTLNRIKKIDADCIFNLIDWSGEDTLFAVKAFDLIEKTGIPYTGATKKNFLLTANKQHMKRAFDRYHIPTPQWQWFTTGRERIHNTFNYPVIVKLGMDHCSIGLNHNAIVKTEKELRTRMQQMIREFHQPVFVETYIVGRELHVSVFEQHKKIVMLPPAEIVFVKKQSLGFLTFESRWDEHHSDYDQSHVVVATLSPLFLKKLEHICKTLFVKLEYRDYTRVDIRVDNKNAIYVLEANANPGLGDEEESAMTVSYRAVGKTFSDIVFDILTSCLQRFGKSELLQ